MAPEVYADAVQMHVTPYTFILNFLVAAPLPGGQDSPAATVRMSHEHAKAMAIMLRKNLKAYEDSNQALIPLHPELWKQLGLSKHEDW
jgi:hypothetical protein